ncbi:MAG: SirB2 family protein [Pseudomonadota bacterium]|nr:SirB2 family protein [Pseudomonadota bacterium]
MYLTIKTIHMTCALISFTGFLFRAYLMVIESKWLNHKYVLVTPHVIDTLFLLSGATMAFMVNFGLFSQMWLTTKITLLMFYLLFVGIALNRGKTRRIRIASFFLAILTFGYIVGVAVVKNPGGWFERL